ncbi:MAG: hypothetical protein U0031_10735 [Thermomicrobiales bacterium]
MSDFPHVPAGLTEESVAIMAAASGVEIAPERLRDVTTVLRELFALEGTLDGLDLDGCGPDFDAASWPEAPR